MSKRIGTSGAVGFGRIMLQTAMTVKIEPTIRLAKPITVNRRVPRGRIFSTVSTLIVSELSVSSISMPASPMC
jgi:hypothetical protein